MTTDLTGESFDFLRGYHQACADINAKALSDMEQAEEQHSKRPASFFGNPTPYHHEKMGRSRALKSLGSFVFDLGNKAFKARLKCGPVSLGA